ncbi:MAG: taurine catabolism dioxygenase TauD [Alphaproteobacteria bacterium]|nr:taurine catabolism dioxygenase TauD [Alphaproteobacteria bacterium]
MAGGSPFDLDDREGYEKWRSEKLKKFPVTPDELMVPIADPRLPTGKEKEAILDRCAVFNMAVYVVAPEANKYDVLALAKLVGLERFDQPLCTGDDGLTEITVIEGGRQGAYIPYSDKPISWHTDGYYNKPDEQVRGFILHCRRAADEGGVSELLDPEIAYIRLRDENPDYIYALMQNDVLTIPGNIENGVLVRDAATGPVFSVQGGQLHMRYTDRKRHIEWKEDAIVLAARHKLTAVLNDEQENIVRWRLAPGQGVLCNNVLHRRSGFTDHPGEDQGRLLYRARYLDRIASPL